MRTLWTLAASTVIVVALGGCADHSALVTSHKGNDVTVRVVEGDAAASHRAARDACALDRKRAVLAGVAADSLRFVCQSY